MPKLKITAVRVPEDLMQEAMATYEGISQTELVRIALQYLMKHKPQIVYETAKYNFEEEGNEG